MSLFSVKCFVVNSVKQDQVNTKDGEKEEEKKFKWYVKKYATPGGGLQCDPGQWW